ncbi:MAG: hypothetical protein CMH54_00160 [Myxococcales bacterium]|nr:hypothetical protein [Myxococcales bacterium]
MTEPSLIVPGLVPIARTVQSQIEALEKTRWSRSFSYRELQELTGYMSSFKATKGTVVFKEGARESYMSLIVDGKVAVVKSGTGRKRRVISQLGPGKILGEMALVDGEPRSASCIALVETELMVMADVDFNTLRKESPPLALKLVEDIARSLSQRLRLTSGELIDQLLS